MSDKKPKRLRWKSQFFVAAREAVVENLEWLMELPKGVLTITADSGSKCWGLTFHKPGYALDAQRRLRGL